MPAPLNTSMHVAPPAPHQLAMGTSSQLHSQDRNTMYQAGPAKSPSSISPPAARVDIGAEALKAFYTSGPTRGRDISELERFVREKEEMNLPPSPSMSQGKPRKSIPAPTQPTSAKQHLPKDEFQSQGRQLNEGEPSRLIYQAMHTDAPRYQAPQDVQPRFAAQPPPPLAEQKPVLTKANSFTSIQQTSLVQKMTDFDRDKVHQERQWLLQRLGELETIERIHDTFLQSQQTSVSPARPAQRSNSFHGVGGVTNYETNNRPKTFGSTPSTAGQGAKDTPPAFNVPLTTQPPQTAPPAFSTLFQTSSPAPEPREPQKQNTPLHAGGYSYYGQTTNPHSKDSRRGSGAGTSKIEVVPPKKCMPQGCQSNNYQSSMRLNLATSTGSATLDYRSAPTGPSDYRSAPTGPSDYRSAATGPSDFRTGPSDFRTGPSDYRTGPTELRPATTPTANRPLETAVNVPLTFSNLQQQQSTASVQQQQHHPLLASTVSSWAGKTVASHTPPPGTLNSWLRQLKESMDVINNQLSNKRGAPSVMSEMAKPYSPITEKSREPLLAISGQPHVSKKADPLSPDKAVQPSSKRYNQPPPVDALLPPPVAVPAHPPKAPPALHSPLSPQPLLRPPSTTSSYEEYSMPELCLSKQAPTVSSVSSVATMGEFAQHKQDAYTAAFKNIGSPSGCKAQPTVSPTHAMMIPIATVPQFKCEFFPPRPASRKEDSGMNTPVDDAAPPAEDP